MIAFDEANEKDVHGNSSISHSVSTEQPAYVPVNFVFVQQNQHWYFTGHVYMFILMEIEYVYSCHVYVCLRILAVNVYGYFLTFQSFVPR
jgi:hypothetical protein